MSGRAAVAPLAGEALATRALAIELGTLLPMRAANTAAASTTAEAGTQVVSAWSAAVATLAEAQRRAGTPAVRRVANVAHTTAWFAR